MTQEAVIAVREVLRLLLAADSYPRLGNHDCREADLLEAEALQKAKDAVSYPDDPPSSAQRRRSCGLLLHRHTGLEFDHR